MPNLLLPLQERGPCPEVGYVERVYSFSRPRAPMGFPRRVRPTDRPIYQSIRHRGRLVWVRYRSDGGPGGASLSLKTSFTLFYVPFSLPMIWLRVSYLIGLVGAGRKTLRVSYLIGLAGAGLKTLRATTPWEVIFSSAVYNNYG